MNANEPWREPDQMNPFLPGYFADPSVLTYEGKHYVYATLDPWGGETLGCWESPDFRHWTYRTLNWPTKAACTSPTSTGAMVWAPAVARGRDGRFYMYVSVGSEIWAGVADHPLGPWRNALGSRPLINADFDRRYHMIDADVFLDEDGKTYLYWGSGWNWVNGVCFAVELADDMTSFAGEPRVVTPENYFEAPAMLKHEGRYYLTYSNGVTIKDTYQVHYAVSSHPLGPFVEGKNSPILTTKRDHGLISPGHHGFHQSDGRTYIVYHRQRLPFEEGTAFRQVCADLLEFTADGEIERVAATHAGPPLIQRAGPRFANRADSRGGAAVSASSERDAQSVAAAAFDNNYATLWAPAEAAKDPWLQVDLGRVQRLHRSELRLEYPWKPYALALQVSEDGAVWRTIVDARATFATGSPVTVSHGVDARYLRLLFAAPPNAATPAVIEWLVQ